MNHLYDAFYRFLSVRWKTRQQQQHVLFSSLLWIVLCTNAFIYLFHFMASCEEMFHNPVVSLPPKIHLLGPGIQKAYLIFPSRYFFVLHRTPISAVQIRPTSSSSSNANIDAGRGSTKNGCRVWTQLFNQSQFCVYLNSTLPMPNTIDELWNQAHECIIDSSSSESDWQHSSNSLVLFNVSIVRYKLLGQHWCVAPLEVAIASDDEILYRQQLFFDKNWSLTSKLYGEQCYCPNEQWPHQMSCQSSSANQRLAQQIEADLKTFGDSINFDSVLRQAIDRFAAYPRTYAFCLYQVISGELYRQCFGEYVGFARFFDEMLLSLLRKVPLQNSEFMVNLGDWPLSTNNIKNLQPLPMFSWCGSTNSYDIVLPTYELTQSVLHSQGRISTDILSTFGKQSVPFAEKVNQLFWRGRDSNRSRLKLIEHSRERPEWYNVSITNFFFFRDEMHKYQSESQQQQQRTASPYVPFEQFFTYRYQLNIDGTVAAYRLPFLLSGSSLVIKQDSTYYEHFYSLLNVGEHYISTKEDLSNLPNILTTLMTESNTQTIDTINATTTANVVNVKQIIWNARAFVLKHLLPQHAYCYYYNALTAYTRLLREPVRLRSNMVKVTSSDDADNYSSLPTQNEKESSCFCDNYNNNNNAQRLTMTKDEL